jgi:hypothetical protein
LKNLKMEKNMQKSNQIKLASLAVCCVAVFVGSYMGTSSAATVTTTTSVEVVDAITITPGANLDFGAVVKPTTASVISMSTGGARAVDSGDAVLVAGDPGTQADYDITATSGETVEISLGTITDPDTYIDLVDDSFRASVAGGADLDIGDSAKTYTSTGADNIEVGASIDIDPQVTSGEYTGSYELNADYQ